MYQIISRQLYFCITCIYLLHLFFYVICNLHGNFGPIVCLNIPLYLYACRRIFPLSSFVLSMRTLISDTALIIRLFISKKTLPFCSLEGHLRRNIKRETICRTDRMRPCRTHCAIDLQNIKIRDDIVYVVNRDNNISASSSICLYS